MVVILLLAAVLAPSNREEVGQRQITWPTVFRAIFIVALPAVLVLFEPDLGTTLVFGFILFVMLFVAGATWRQMLALTAAAALGVVVTLQQGWLADTSSTGSGSCSIPASTPKASATTSSSRGMPSARASFSQRSVRRGHPDVIRVRA